VPSAATARAHRGSRAGRYDRPVFEEIRPQLWRWEVPHPEWTPEEAADGGWERVVASYAALADETLLLMDPLAPEAGTPEEKRFWDALDEDVRHHGPPSVLLTIFFHTRSAQAVLDRHPGATLWAYEPARSLVAERARVTDSFLAGDALPGGAVGYDAGREGEVVLWLPSHRALVVGDVVLGAGGGEARLSPESWLGKGQTHDDVRRALGPVLDLPIDVLLLTHGEVVEADAVGALRRALEARPVE
jgi:glyoxylase-like metal-dependent hydrolase (beta-lactamase superfamily II)